jgi:hypothetical protein
MAMQKYWMLLPILAVTACGPSDHCEVPPQPKTLAVKDLTLVQKADAMGVPPSQVPEDAVGGPAFDEYVARHNEAARVGYCMENEAYKARNMKDEMATLARAIMATCKVPSEPDALAMVLKYRNCASGNK